MQADELLTHGLVVAGAVAGAVAYLHGQIRSVEVALTAKVDSGIREVRDDIAKERVVLASHIATSDGLHREHDRRIVQVEGIQASHAKSLNHHRQQLVALSERSPTPVSSRPTTAERAERADDSESWRP